MPPAPVLAVVRREKAGREQQLPSANQHSLNAVSQKSRDFVSVFQGNRNIKRFHVFNFNLTSTVRFLLWPQLP